MMMRERTGGREGRKDKEGGERELEEHRGRQKGEEKGTDE